MFLAALSPKGARPPKRTRRLDVRLGALWSLMLCVYIPTGLIKPAADKVFRCKSASERSRGFPSYYAADDLYLSLREPQNSHLLKMCVVSFFTFSYFVRFYFSDNATFP